MKASVVRLTGITIKNFKNVMYGNLSFENTRKNFKSSILGLYGQNGSGKTALIDAIELLQHALCGRQLPDYFVDYINIETQEATITYDFSVQLEDQKHIVSYQLSIRGEDIPNDQNSSMKQNITKKTVVKGELIKCPILSDNKIRSGRLIDTNESALFTPVPKRTLLVGKDKDTITELLVAKKLTAVTSRSFVFSPELLKVIREHVKEENSDSEELAFYSDLIEALVDYGNHGLFVINTSNSGLISLNAQPLIFKYKEKNLGAIGTMMLPLDSPMVIDQTQKQIVEGIIDNMNIVLTQIIPGLSIVVKDLGKEVKSDGNVGNRIQLMSCRNGNEIALKYESEGIKKIVSILQLLIVVYNDASITVAIDELDAGVFEYLLGEILRIISEKGRGQLVFTSHNLRPLETLDRGFIAFTTINPNNRFVRMTNVKDNNNLRDLYYRDIMLGEHNEELYEATNNSEIAYAFREAGEYSGS